MTRTTRLIGLYGVTQLEIANHRFLGATRYCEKQRALAIRNFRVENLDGICDRLPPWKGRADGVVLCIWRDPKSPHARLADWVLSGGVPAVSVLSDWFDDRIPMICIDPQSLAEVAVRHLVKCGCESFLFVGYRRSTGGERRGKAFRKSLAKRGRQSVEYAAEALFTGSVDDEVRVREERELARHLRELPKPLGVWALNDNFAAAVCVLCGQLSLEVPRSVKVLGVDDTCLARTNQPALSTIRTAGEEVGYRAMQILHGLLAGNVERHATIAVNDTDLVVRMSTGEQPRACHDLHEVLDHVARYACDGLTLDQLPSIAGVSRRSLEEQFRKVLGRSPAQEIRRVRLDRAKVLLSTTRFSVSRIATMVGFAESAAFSKFFTKQTGLSPREYRRQQQWTGAMSNQ